jgi:transglutaminase-like putative cysteine protease
MERGSDWCTDMARVACVMCQVAGLPARIVSLFNTGQAYSGHSIIEVYRVDAWGAADPVNGIIYRRLDGAPATTWELMSDHSLIQLAWKDDGNFYADPGQFTGTAVSNYFVSDSPTYDFAVSGVNDYNRAVLEMSGRGWPGGLRWLHGEDRE